MPALTDEQRAAGEKALLSIKVCDPAAGSGHFLVKANNALGAELARIRTGDEYPAEAAGPGRQARRAGPLHLRRGPEPDGGGAVQGQPVDQRQRARQAAQLPRPPHQVRQLADRGHAGADGRTASPPTPLPKAVTGDDRATAKRFRARTGEERREYERAGAYQWAFQVTVIRADGRTWQRMDVS